MYEGVLRRVEDRLPDVIDHFVGIETVRDDVRLEPEPIAQVIGDWLGHAHDRRRMTQRSFESAIEGAQRPKRPIRARWLETPPVAQLRDPAKPAMREAGADKVRGLRRRGREHTVEATLAGESARTR